MKQDKGRCGFQFNMVASSILSYTNGSGAIVKRMSRRWIYCRWDISTDSWKMESRWHRQRDKGCREIWDSEKLYRKPAARQVSFIFLSWTQRTSKLRVDRYWIRIGLKTEKLKIWLQNSCARHSAFPCWLCLILLSHRHSGIFYPEEFIWKFKSKMGKKT